MALSARIAALSEPTPVVIADDEPLVRTLLATVFGSRNVRLYQATNGREALELVRLHHPRLVLLDIEMPEMDGLTACAQIKADPTLADVTVVLTTGRDQMTDIHEGRTTGADHYLTKPFGVAQLGELIDILLIR